MEQAVEIKTSFDWNAGDTRGAPVLHSMHRRQWSVRHAHHGGVPQALLQLTICRQQQWGAGPQRPPAQSPAPAAQQDTHTHRHTCKQAPLTKYGCM